MLEQIFGGAVLISGLVAYVAAMIWTIKYFWKQGYKQELLIAIACAVIGAAASLTETPTGTVVWFTATVIAAYIASVFLDHVLGKIGDKGSKLLKVAIYTILPTGTIWKFAAIAVKNFQNNQRDDVQKETVFHEQTVDEAVDTDRINAEVHETGSKQATA